MRIIADENIPYVREAFGPLGDVQTISGRSINADAIKDADILLVRSITRVDRSLLEGSSVRFVGTATIGDDHIDKAYLAERGIAFAAAPGSNAESVAQYVAAGLLVLAERFQRDLTTMTLGIVGVGNVGRRVHRVARALGLDCVLNDPPLARETGDPRYRPIEEILACDAVSLHVPLTRHGPDATFHLADASFLRGLRRGAILINTSRGPVADGAALLRALDDRHLGACILDVWEGEPDIDTALLKRVLIGTPHIAGYSFDGKVNGARMIYEAACRFLNVPPHWDPAPLLPEPECPRLVLDGAAPNAVSTAVRAVYDIMNDDAALRGILTQPEAERRKRFDRLRKEYPRRREFSNTRVVVVPPNPALEQSLAGIGFTLEKDKVNASQGFGHRGGSPRG
jgi:erythronate-4-phosphate dehydrogenase